MKFDEQAILTTKSGHPISKAFFPDALARTAAALMHAASQTVGLYKGNPFYNDNRPTLNPHVGGIIDVYQSMPTVSYTLNNPLDNLDRYITACATGEEILSHDWGEVPPGEGLSFYQKMLYKELIPSTKYLEGIAAPFGYEFALHHAILNTPQEFLKSVAFIQNTFGNALENLPTQAEKEPFYKQQVDHIICVMNNELDAVKQKTTPVQQTYIQKRLETFKTSYESCEVSDKKTVSNLITKTLDKNCPSYNENGFKKYLNPDMKSITMDREPNAVAIKTIQRSEEFLLRLAQEAKSDPIASYFYQDVNTVVCDYLKKYTLLGRPLIYLNGQTPQEVDIHAPRSLFVENYLQQKELIDQRRANHIHPLQDTIINSGEEIAALAMTNQQLHLKNTHSILDRSTKPSRQMIEAFDHNLKTIQSNPIPKHPDYVTRTHP